MRVGAAQHAERGPTESDAQCLAALSGRAKRARARGVDLLLCPELSLCGYSVPPEVIRQRAQPRDGPLLRAVAGLANDVGMAIAVGYAERPSSSASTIYNSLALFDAKGRLALHYRKTHLFGAAELALFTPGGADQLRVVTLQPSGVRVGALICMDCEYVPRRFLLPRLGEEEKRRRLALADGRTDDGGQMKMNRERLDRPFSHIAMDPSLTKSVGQPRTFSEPSGPA